MTEKEIIARIRRLDKAISSYRKKNKLQYYNKDVVHEKQMIFHKCAKRNRWVFGGNRSGKTECGAAEAVWLARGNHPFKTNKSGVEGWVVSVSRDVQRDVAQRKILQYLNPDWIESVVMVSGKSSNPMGGVIDYISIKNVFGGLSRITFKSCEMGREKFQGTSLDFVWFDEEPPEDIYDECVMRVLDKKGELFGTMTPLKGLTFIYDRIYLNSGNSDEVWYEGMEWADNPYLDKDEVRKLSAAMSDDLLSSRRYGRFIEGSGPVYPEFDENVNVIEPFSVPPSWQDKLSIDPGLNNPLSCHWYAVDGDGNIFVVAEHYEAGKEVGYHAQRIKEISKTLSWHTDSFGRIEALIDSAANQKTLASLKSVTQLFCEHGINVNPKVNKDLFSGISRVKEYLCGAYGKKLYVFKNCVNLIRELKAYRWGSGDVPKKIDDHCLDELRYYVMARPKPAIELTKKSEIALDKERLIGKIRRKR
ncbi:MAG: terminase family protein [Clostridia bacterium]|nr:terminase family protein [Clostridia bacterium]